MIGNLRDVPIMVRQAGKSLGMDRLCTARDPNSAKDMNYKRGWALRLIGKYEDSLAAFKQSRHR